jgi:hypothetical protein
VKLSSVLLAKTLAYIEIADLNAKGNVFVPELIKALGERYKFHILPKLEERGEKGLVFEEGRIGNKVITKFTILDAVLVLETRSNTSDSKQILEDMLLWGAAKFGFTYTPESIKRFAYVSDVTFYSEVSLLDAACQPLLDLATKTSAALTEIWQEPVQYHPANLAIAHDPMARSYAIAPFTITHRAEARYSENKYFSEAPLPTDMHISFLEEFEAGIKRLHEQQRGNQ